MDILKQSNVNPSEQKTRPIFLVTLLVALIGFACFWYYKNNPSFLENSLINPPETAVPTKSIVIDVNFLKSEELQSLEAFPDYTAFREATGLEVEPGRPNPFLPSSGTNTTR